MTIPILDFMTMDIYNDDTFSSVAASCPGCATYTQWAQLAKDNGKGVYVAETWTPAYLPNPLPAGAISPTGFLTTSLDELSIVGAVSPDFAALDASWLQAIANFASANGLEAITAFTTQAFFAYGDRVMTKLWILSIP